MAVSINDVLLTATEAPCSSKLTEIIKNEIKNGNVVTAFNRVTSLPDETYYILLFRDMPKENYPCVKKCQKKNGADYSYIVLTDSNGCTEIRFNY
ncbi:MAG: hypothetical protein K2N72_09690 [Oscillospiraceae bacterium]|nr:hypothetical protein [Oscillospiraceae bacterium]